jgi:hypothetical protein
MVIFILLKDKVNGKGAYGLGFSKFVSLWFLSSIEKPRRLPKGEATTTPQKGSHNNSLSREATATP